jgi:hypothetical protein
MLRINTHYYLEGGNDREKVSYSELFYHTNSKIVFSLFRTPLEHWGSIGRL